MHRAGLATVALLFSWLASLGVAEAQNIDVSVLALGDRTSVNLDTLGSTTGAPVRTAECDAIIRFRFRGIDQFRSELRFFEGSMCDQVSVRTDMTSRTCNALDVPSVAIDRRTERDVDVPVDLLVPCGEGGSGVENIWVLAVDNETSEVSGAGQQAQFNIAFNFTTPSAPGTLTARPGENAVTLTWDAEGDAQFEVFVDPDGCTDGEVTSEELTPDATESTLARLKVSGPISGTSTTVPYPDDVPIGGEMAVAIRSTSRTGNPGELSEIVCVERIETTSWWEMYCGGGGEGADSEVCRDDGGTCSVAAPGRTASGALSALLGLALLALVLRRSRR